MKQNLMKSFLLTTLVLAIALPAIAQPQLGPMGPGSGPMLMMAKLNLSAEQEQQMQDLQFSREKKAINLRAELQQERLMLRKLRQADEPNKKKLYAQIEKVGAVQVKLDKSRIDHFLSVRKILTAEQFEIFRQNMPRQSGSRRGPKGMQDRPFKRPCQNRF